MDVIVRSNNKPVNDMIVLMSGLIIDLDKALRQRVVKVCLDSDCGGYHVTNKTNNSLEVTRLCYS